MKGLCRWLALPRICWSRPRGSRSERPPEEEQVADAHAAGQQPARVVAEIEDQAAHPLPAMSPSRACLRSSAVFSAKPSDADVADAVVAGEEEIPGAVGVAGIAAHGIDHDGLAHIFRVDRLLSALVEDRER